MMDRKTIMVLIPVGVAVIVVGIILLATRKGGPVEPGKSPASSAGKGTTGLPADADGQVAPGLIPAGAEKDADLPESGEDRRSDDSNDVITVFVTAYPEPAAKGNLLAIYSDGTQQREFEDRQSPGQMTLKGPNRLGGELVVYRREPARPPRLWARIKKLEQRQVHLPADADLVVGDQDLTQVYLSFAEEDQKLLEHCKGVAFCSSLDSKVPLFFAALHDGPVQVTDYNSVPLDIVPGTYYVRAIVSGEGEETLVPLGRLEVSKEASKSYRLYLPSK